MGEELVERNPAVNQVHDLRVRLGRELGRWVAVRLDGEEGRDDDRLDGGAQDLRALRAGAGQIRECVALDYVGSHPYRPRDR